MKTTLKRFLLILAIHLVAIEIIVRLAVSRPESWEEKLMILQMLLFTIALIWAVLPAFSGFRARVLFRIGLFAGFAFLTQVISHFYAWSVRPNVGFYEEPQWVAKHPAFQKEHRKMIERKLW